MSKLFYVDADRGDRLDLRTTVPSEERTPATAITSRLATRLSAVMRREVSRCVGRSSTPSSSAQA
jgi:hypothetical protein